MIKAWKSIGGIPVVLPSGGDITTKVVSDGLDVWVCAYELSKADKRRLAQNKCYWGWLTDLERTKVNAIAGMMKEDWHERFKYDFLVPIFIRDDKEYAKTFTTLEVVLRQMGRPTHKVLLDNVLKMTTTTNASPKQFTEYLRCIEQFAHGNGAVLRTDPEIYKRIFS